MKSEFSFLGVFDEKASNHLLGKISSVIKIHFVSKKIEKNFLKISQKK
jgi:hypothetical protein